MIQFSSSKKRLIPTFLILLSVPLLFGEGTEASASPQSKHAGKKPQHGKHVRKSHDLAAYETRCSYWDDFLNEKLLLNSQIKKLENKGIRIADNGVNASDGGSDLTSYFEKATETKDVETVKAELVSEIQGILSGISAYTAQYGNFPYRMTLTKKGKAYLMSEDSPNLLYADVTNELSLMRKKASVIGKWIQQIREIK